MLPVCLHAAHLQRRPARRVKLCGVHSYTCSTDGGGQDKFAGFAPLPAVLCVHGQHCLACTARRQAVPDPQYLVSTLPGAWPARPACMQPRPQSTIHHEHSPSVLHPGARKHAYGCWQMSKCTRGCTRTKCVMHAAALEAHGPLMFCKCAGQAGTDTWREPGVARASTLAAFTAGTGVFLPAACTRCAASNYTAGRKGRACM